MERVETLVKKLLTQLQQNATAAEMLISCQMLHAELQTEANKATAAPAFGISILTQPVFANPQQQNVAPQTEENTTVVAAEPEPTEPAELEPLLELSQPQKIVSVLEVDEAILEEELAQINNQKTQHQNLAALGHTSVKQLVAEEPIDAPTEVHQLIAQNETTLNDKLKQGDLNLGDTLTEAPVKDLRKAIGINDRFLFVNELFRGDEAMYERCIKTINNFTILPEAEYWIQRELSVKIGWDETSDVVKQFKVLIKRRFL
jgi:hypothetical protein